MCFVLLFKLLITNPLPIMYCLVRRNRPRPWPCSPLLATYHPPPPLQALGHRSPSLPAPHLEIFHAWFCSSHCRKLHYPDIFSRRIIPCRRDSGTSVSGRKVGSIMKRPYFESVPVKSLNRLRLESVDLMLLVVRRWSSQALVVQRSSLTWQHKCHHQLAIPNQATHSSK